MSVDEKEDTGIDSLVLRAELKQWEGQFKAANGRKAGREDIKKDASISAKYKLYDRLTRPPKQPTRLNATPRKSRQADASAQESPEKQSTTAAAATPRKTPRKSKEKGVATLSPVQEVDPTPAFIRNALGPTPQKDGHVLGIFDMIAEETPLKGDTSHIIGGTPSKHASAGSNQAHFKSPEDSNGKRFFLNAFVGTPLKRKRDDNDIGTTSSSKRKFATPSFLRRSFPLASIQEDGADVSSKNAPFRKRGLVRSLSSIIQGLKKQEESRMDDEWDVLNEIEEEELEGSRSIHKKSHTSEVQVADSQAVEMPLGPDQAANSSDESSEDEAQNAGRKPWKKKGLKRQTRRVIMRPVMHKSKKAEDAADEGDSGGEPDRVTETQLQADGNAGAEDEQGGESGDELAAATGHGKASKSSSKGKKEQDKDSSKKQPKKIDPNKHANFRKLNIKNKNSKANGRGKKFGRR